MNKGTIENGKLKGTDYPALQPHESAAAVLKVVDAAKKEDSGKFYSYDGTILPY